MRALSIGLLALVVLAAGHRDLRAEPTSPDRVAGLVAWYKLQSLHRTFRDGQALRAWPDASGNGRDLKAVGQGQPAVFRTLKLNRLPVLEIGEATSFSVQAPFELQDHTIFLVYGTRSPGRALLSSDANAYRGIMLRDEDRFDELRDGMTRWPYNRARAPEDRFWIVALSRASGLLSAFTNGARVSTDREADMTLRVGRFFYLRQTTAVDSDGAGLSIAEMLFYDRELADDERQAITDHLGKKYGIEVKVAAPLDKPEPGLDWDRARILARLGSSAKVDLNAGVVVVPWNDGNEVGAPLTHDASGENTRLLCTRDGTRLHLQVALTLVATKPGARLRVMVLKNGAYEEEEGEALPAPDDAGGLDELRLVTRFETSLTVDAGDAISIVTARDGGDGKVLCEPDSCSLLAAVE